MSKRKLNRRQRQRINAAHKARVEDHATRSGEKGLVVAHHGKRVHVEDAAGVRHHCHFRANLPPLVVGDQVLFEEEDKETGIINAILPRDNLLQRPDNYGKLKPVAANIGHLFIVFACEPLPSSQLIDRYLVAAELAGIAPVLVANKSDLGIPKDDLLDIYRQLNYPLINASCENRTGLNQLLDIIGKETVAFVGQSGVGKSSLINTLLGDDQLATKQISDVSGLGQHTTVASRLLHLPQGGRVIDSPGVREFGLWHIDETQLLRGYVELAKLAGHCKFRNCSHQHEPGCALIAAAENGDISPQRLENFHAIADTLDEKSRARY